MLRESQNPLTEKTQPLVENTRGDPDESFWKPRLETRANGQFIYPNDSHVLIWKDEINLLF